METIKKVKVENMTSPRTGKEVANQFRIYTDEGVYFQSYKSIIAFIPSGSSQNRPTAGKIVLDENKWDYSTTTGKYRNEFLGEGIAETRNKIKSGEYILTDLN